MRITVDRVKFLDALKSVASVMTDRPTHPVLANFLIAIEGETITIRGTDLSSTIVRTVPIELGEFGDSFCLPKKLTLELLASFAGDEVVVGMESGDTVASLKCDTAEIKIQTIAPDDFPAMPAVSEKTRSIILPVEKLSEAINRVTATTSTDETKMILRGVHIKGDGANLELAATDGHCLCFARIKSELEVDGLTFLPSTLQTIISNANKSKVKEVEIKISDLEIVSTFDDFWYSGRMMQGNYPKYQDLIPSKNDCSIEVNRKDFLEAVELVSIVSQASKNSLLTIEGKDGELSIESIVVDSGAARQVIKYSGSDAIPKIGFNAKYLLKAIKFHNTEIVSVNLNGAIRPTTLTSLKNDSLYLVMPIQLRD